MRKTFVVLFLLGLFLLYFGCISENVQPKQVGNVTITVKGGEEKTESNQSQPTQVVIVYEDKGTGEKKRILATLVNEGEYKTEEGNIVTKEVVKEIKEILTVNNTLCCPCETEKPCVEPEPVQLYLCDNGKVSDNIADCGITCDQKAEKLVYVCADGKEVSDPTACGGVQEVKFICANGTETYSAADCGCKESTQATVAYVCKPNVEKTIYTCVDGSVTDKKELCGLGVKEYYYVCTDGRHVREKSDCSSGCSVSTKTNLPSPKIVYKCWDGKIVSSKGECPSYCNQKCVCPDYYKPVCVDGKTYPNACYAKCAGAKDYKPGECEQYKCLKEGEKCEPLDSTALAVVKYVCCPGLVCAPKPVSGQATAAHLSVEYVCQKPEEKQEKPPLETCAKEGETCTIYTTAAGKASTCCNGLYCGANGVCVNESKPWCKDSDNGKNLYKAGVISWGTGSKVLGMESDKCDEEDKVVEWYCLDNVGYSKITSCEPGEVCVDGACVQKGKECKDYCSNGIAYKSCYYDAAYDECRCTVVQCASGTCNPEGTGCGSEQPSDCPYEYCKDGVFYSGCYKSAASAQCVCQTVKPCEKQVCNAEGTACG